MVAKQITAKVVKTAADPKTSLELQRLAQAAIGKKSDSEEMNALLHGVGVTPEALAALKPQGGRLEWQPTLTLLTLTSAACTTTTTTTTTIGTDVAKALRATRS